MPKNKIKIAVPPSVKGSLVIIGGREDKEKEMFILREVAERIGRGKLVVATVASSVGDELWDDYRRIFRRLGVKKISHLDVVSRTESVDKKALKAVEGAHGVFFTGGDQLKITSELGGTEICSEIHSIYANGGVIAGTSAGASVMSETMLVSGPSDSSFKIGGALRMAPGLGFFPNVIIDQHFAERGRVSRLLGAVALNPKFLGIGIDEDTAITMNGRKVFEVMGRGAVYVIDAHESTECNVSEAQPDSTLSIFNVRLHVLCCGDKFDVEKRTPVPKKTGDQKESA